MLLGVADFHGTCHFDEGGRSGRGDIMEDQVDQTSQLTMIKRVVELGDDAIISIPDAATAYLRVPNLANQLVKTRAMTIAIIGILTMPLGGLMMGDENVWDRLQALVESERAAKNESTVLAVDTNGVRVRSKSSSTATKEFFEQAVLEHLAKLQHTFNSWSERTEELMGSVSLKIAIDSSGNVARVETVNSHISNSSFIKTVIDDVREWKFSKGSSEAAEITVPLLFIPKGMDTETIVQWERKVRGGPRHDGSPRQLPVVTVPPASGSDKLAAPAVAKLTPIQNIQNPMGVMTPTTLKTSAIATAAAAPKARAATKPLLVVIANRQLAIRDNPRYSANSVREVEESTQLSILENRGDWLKVRTAQGDAIGFIRKEYVSPSNG